MAETQAISADPDDFETTQERIISEALRVDVGGYEGPLDLLLTLARTQKVDLRKISVLALAEQYLAFVATAKKLRIELAADYLVMAAWLAFLKSRLLLPVDPSEDGPSGEELAAHLAFQLERLEAMRDAAARLMARDQIGRDFFARGVQQDVIINKKIRYVANVLDLMQAYARTKTKDSFAPLHLAERNNVLTMEQALARMKTMMGLAIDWADIVQFLPEGWAHDAKKRRSATASTFAATLELVKAGTIEIRQSESFAPIQLRKREVR
jgi:segregation and condensation protein A